MNRITIEYQTTDGRNLSKQLMAAVLEVLELNHAECTTFSHRKEEGENLKTFAFMTQGKGGMLHAENRTI